ncbi:MAG: hypothetical protein IPJ04_04790 [Candidatus Eisenbacteria bacterium]|nr:hypothetical protein [Candidatus Eisenbacteria bacterium]
MAVKYLGGSYMSRVERGQPGEVNPVTPVPRPKAARSAHRRQHARAHLVETRARIKRALEAGREADGAPALGGMRGMFGAPASAR